ncbi:short chain oxidoreductase [Gautieria morchelliformis]|nr:short chain oxidoreductase [Gautieria morchelliformis]
MACSIAGTRIAIVTGAAQGIGRAIALRLADDGLDVVAFDLPSKANKLDTLLQDITSRKRRGLAVIGDASKETDIQNLVNTTAESLGGLDVMVANAGMGYSSPLVTTSVEEWDLMQAVNVRSVFLSYKAAAVQMIQQGRGGRIIGAASIAAKQGVADFAPYSAAKFAVRGLTQSVALELTKHEITVNAYAPGTVDTDIWKAVEVSRDKHGLPNIPADFPRLLPLIPTENVAALVSHLVKEESKFITGQTLNINGGTYFD